MASDQKVSLKVLAPDSKTERKAETLDLKKRDPASLPEAKTVTPDSTAPDDGKWVPILKFPGRR